MSTNIYIYLDKLPDFVDAEISDTSLKGKNILVNKEVRIIQIFVFRLHIPLLR